MFVGVNWLFFFFCLFASKDSQPELVSLVVIISILCYTPPRRASRESLIKVESLVEWMGWKETWVMSGVFLVCLGTSLFCIPRTTSRCLARSPWWFCYLLLVNCFHHTVSSHVLHGLIPHFLNHPPSSRIAMMCLCIYSYNKDLSRAYSVTHTKTIVVGEMNTAPAVSKNSTGKDSSFHE